MGRDGVDPSLYKNERFQFTRPHGARPASSSPAPGSSCFNSRARMGRDIGLMVTVFFPASFNSRARMGRDLFLPVSSHPLSVSIHAPAWGATRRPPEKLPADAVSIHAPAWGATSASSATRSQSTFQFTRPHGARRETATGVAPSKKFQFTRPHGARRTPLRRQPC